MASGGRGGDGADRPSRALAELGTVLLVLATLVIAGLAVYLVLNPPGVLDPASQQSALPTSSATAPAAGTPAATTGSAASPAPPAAPGQLSIGPACGAVSPLLDRSDAIRGAAQEDASGVASEDVLALTTELAAVRDASPPELSTLIDPLIGVLFQLNDSILAGEENPTLDSELATSSTQSILDLCRP